MSQTTEKYSRYFTYIKPFTKFPIVKNYGSTIFTLASIVIFIFFAIKPTVETILTLEKKIDNAKAVLESINKKADDLTLAKENYQKIPESIKNKVDIALPNSVDIKNAIFNLEQAARLHEATISALQIQPFTIDPKNEGSPSAAVSSMDFTFNITGRYSDLSLLLQDIVSSSRVISIDHISINKASEGNNLLMSLNGKMYYLK